MYGIISLIKWLRQMRHADWLIRDQEKVILPARANIAHKKNRKLKLSMPYNDNENHSPSEFYYPEQTNDPNKYGERLAAKAFFGLFYKVTTNCNPTKPYNKSLFNLVCSVCTGKY